VATPESRPSPPAFDQYVKWLAGKCTSTEIASAESRLRTVGATLAADVESSSLWQQLLGSLRNIEDEYTSFSDFRLFVTQETPEIVQKPYESVLEKSFRKNILLNKHWPEPPDGGWITPANWFERTNDIIRTMMIVKYLDGVEFLVNRIREIADEHSSKFSVDYEASDEGYYAAHCYPVFELDVPKLDWDTEKQAIRLEIQVTTQLQDVIRKLTHKYYEQRRAQEIPSRKWQWNYASPEFVPNYLGHILHYVEGMIMDVRMRGRTE